MANRAGEPILNRPEASAKRVGGHAARVLATGARAGVVDSTFRHGILLRLEGDAGPILISLQSAAAAFHPWAIETADVPPVSIGTPAAASEVAIRFHHGPTLDISGAAVVSLDVKPYTTAQLGTARSRLRLLEAALDTHRKSTRDPFTRQIDRILATWTGEANSEVLAALVGLGPGSTPAGDDVLVGLLAGLRGRSCRVTLDGELWQLRAVIHADLMRTTQSSVQMLTSALEGAFPEPLLRVVHELGDSTSDDATPRASIGVMLRLGGSSGCAMLVGLRSSLAPLPQANHLCS